MVRNRSKQRANIEQFLIEAAEVQLAAFDASIDFWTKWLAESLKISSVLSKGLKDVKSDPDNSGKIFVKMADDSKTHFRSMMSLPREFAESFIKHMDRNSKNGKAAKRKSKTNREKSRNARIKN